MTETAAHRMIVPRLAPLLDRAFRPAVLANHAFRATVDRTGQGVPVGLALERGDGGVSRFHTALFPSGHPGADDNFFFLERLLKFLLWSRGGWRVHYSGPPELGAQLQQYYRESITGQFDARLMGDKIFQRPFEVVLRLAEEMPPNRESTAPLGRHWNGCRLGFDLGASDRKVAAVIDGETVFSEEVPWDPRPQSDPQWHFDQIMDSLKRAARHLPRVDAIGGSAAGVYVNNRVQVASLFRGVSEDLFHTRIRNLFLEIQHAWNDVPIEVVNDGEVTALAGAMALNDHSVLGVALGSSQAAGFVNREGNITAWLNELAFAPVDYSPTAPVDEWSGDRGCGVQYFSQQCVGRLLPVAGLEVPASLPLPERLVRVQELMAKGDDRAAKIYQTIGAYFGYATAHYADFYEFKHLLVLGRVTTGPGGELMVREARRVLEEEFPELAGSIALHLPSEKEKRHGQAIAAASLPVVDGK